MFKITFCVCMCMHAYICIRIPTLSWNFNFQFHTINKNKFSYIVFCQVMKCVVTYSLFKVLIEVMHIYPVPKATDEEKSCSLWRWYKSGKFLSLILLT